VLLDGLRTLPGVVLHGGPARRTPTVLLSVEGRDPRDVSAHLAARGVNAPAGHFYALELSRWMGLGGGGAVRAGLAPYTDRDDVDRLLAAVAELAA
jgi:selenocysteine lyase/cysteine desulfurase